MQAAFFINNRQNLKAMLPADSAVVLTAFCKQQRVADEPFEFVQESSFWYLTGIDEADWWLIIDVKADKTWLVRPNLTRYQEIFEGGLSPEQASRVSSVREVITRQEANNLFADLLPKRKVYTLGAISGRAYGFTPNPAQAKLRKALRAAKQLHDVRLPLAKLRAIKQPAEIVALQKAVDITAAGIQKVIDNLDSCQHDYQAEAILRHEFINRGAMSHAFNPIISSGKNTCTLHYAIRGEPLKPGEWVLMDVGARFEHYNADITRMVPPAKPSVRARRIYDAVVSVHDYAISLLKAGQNVEEYLAEVDARMFKELRGLKLITNPKEVRKYFPHAIGHGLGIDTHDALGRPTEFQQGMVLTVEPGIYIPEEGLGFRVEDDIVITAGKPQVLSSKLPVL